MESRKLCLCTDDFNSKRIFSFSTSNVTGEKNIQNFCDENQYMKCDLWRLRIHFHLSISLSQQSAVSAFDVVCWMRVKCEKCFVYMYVFPRPQNAKFKTAIDFVRKYFLIWDSRKNEVSGTAIPTEIRLSQSFAY